MASSTRRHLLTNGATVALAQVVSIGFIFAQNVVLARMLGLEDFGLFQLLFTIGSLALVFGRPGAITVISKGVLKGYDAIIVPEMRRSLHSGALWAGVALLSAAVAALAGFAYAAAIALVVAGFTVLASLEKFDAVLQAKQAWWASRSLVVGQAAITCGCSGAVAWATRSPWWTLLSILVVRFVVLIIGWVAVRRLMNTCPIEPQRETELRHEGTAYTRIAWLNQIADHIGRLVLGMIDPTLLAVYSVGAIIPRRIVDNAKLVMAVPIVHLGRSTAADNLRVLVRWFPLSIAAGVLAAVLLSVSAPFLIPWLYGPDYHDAVWISQALSLTLITAFSGTLILSYDINQVDGRFFRRQRIWRLSSWIALSVLLVSLFQVRGAVIAQVLVEAVFGVNTLLYLARTWKNRQRAEAGIQ